VTASFKRRRPAANEYFEYYGRYISLVPQGDIINILKEQLISTLDFLHHIPEDMGDIRYQPEKWSIKEVIGHFIDVEWVFTYRALRFARNDETFLHGIEQDDLVAGANFAERNLSSLSNEFEHLRSANIVLFDSFDENILDRTGTASGYKFTVRSVIYVIAGHELHHIQILKERYL
jgi:hypothetical protein